VKKDNEEITMKQDVDLSRRNFLLGSAATIVGGVLAGGIVGSLVKPGTARAALPGYLPPPGGTLDINSVKKAAFSYYFSAGG
jgi:hypothetical protein